jgi:hypothetical protein
VTHVGYNLYIESLENKMKVELKSVDEIATAAKNDWSRPGVSSVFPIPRSAVTAGAIASAPWGVDTLSAMNMGFRIAKTEDGYACIMVRYQEESVITLVDTLAQVRKVLGAN